VKADGTYALPISDSYSVPTSTLAVWPKISANVGDPDPDPHVFGPPGSRSISQMYGSGSHKGVERAEIMLAKLKFNTKF
jgi:hypothetical protein